MRIFSNNIKKLTFITTLWIYWWRAVCTGTLYCLRCNIIHIIRPVSFIKSSEFLILLLAKELVNCLLGKVSSHNAPYVIAVVGPLCYRILVWSISVQFSFSNIHTNVFLRSNGNLRFSPTHLKGETCISIERGASVFSHSVNSSQNLLVFILRFLLSFVLQLFDLSSSST
jgi:hypothetical protein